MTVLELEFPAGRYHATPWGRHVNEGAVEWPPSPWRILRALVATWYWKARETKELEEQQVRILIHSLAAVQPVFHLPRATLGHTRHYMPINSLDPNKKPKIFDAFVQIASSEPVLVAWDVKLPVDQLDTLNLLAARIGYLGRAESLVVARVNSTLLRPSNTRPLRDDETMGERQELVRLLLPMSSEFYAGWQTSKLLPPRKLLLRRLHQRKRHAHKPNCPPMSSRPYTPIQVSCKLQAGTCRQEQCSQTTPDLWTYSRPPHAKAAPAARVCPPWPAIKW